MSLCVYLGNHNQTVDRAYLYLGAVEHQPAEPCKFGDVCEGLRVEAVAGGQVELLQPRTSLRDDLQTGLIQEVAARQLQAGQAETAGLHEAEGKNGWRGKDMRGNREEQHQLPTSPPVPILENKANFHLYDLLFSFCHELKKKFQSIFFVSACPSLKTAHCEYLLVSQGHLSVF